jgi:hypothetical protein
MYFSVGSVEGERTARTNQTASKHLQHSVHIDSCSGVWRSKGMSLFDIDPSDPNAPWAQLFNDLFEDEDEEEVEEDEEWHQQEVLQAAALAGIRARFDEYRNERRFRASKYPRVRMSWADVAAEGEHSGDFRETFRMSRTAFDDLVALLGERIEVDIIKSLNSTPHSNDRIFPEMVVAIGLRFLAGGKPLDIKLWAGISRPSVYRIKDMFLDAVIGTRALDVDWPDTAEKCWALAQGFKNISSHGVMDKVVGALDGILIPIQQPTGVLNPRAYFSGHYKKFGISLQVVCDAKMRILYYGILGPGTLFYDLNQISLSDCSHCAFGFRKHG